MDPAVQPNTTLYINNLNDKVNKEELRTQLYALFATHGKVIDVVATKSPKMRGQAFLVFADLAGATAAMRACAGMTFYDKPLVRDCQPISTVFQVDPTRFLLFFHAISEPPFGRPTWISRFLPPVGFPGSGMVADIVCQD